MVWYKLCWDTNNAVGLPKQRNLYQSSPTFLCFESPAALFVSQHNLFQAMWLDREKGPIWGFSKNLQISTEETRFKNYSKASHQRIEHNTQAVLEIFTTLVKVHLTPNFFFGRNETVQHSHKEFDNLSVSDIFKGFKNWQKLAEICYQLVHDRVSRGPALFLIWRHRLIYMALTLCEHACKTVCDAKLRIDPCPSPARSWDKVYPISGRTKKFQMLQKNVKSLLEQLQVCIFAEIVFGVRCTLTLSCTTIF